MSVVSIEISLYLTLFMQLYMLVTSAGTNDWAYEGPKGPDHWYTMYPYCGKGQENEKQSPINIVYQEGTSYIPTGVFKDVEFMDMKIKPNVLNITNTGKMLEVNFPKNAPRLSGGPLDSMYKLKQMHFHWSQDDRQGSEHYINCRQYALEMHLVFFNKEAQDRLVAVSVMFELSDAEENENLNVLLDSTSQTVDPGSTTIVRRGFDIKTLLPSEISKQWISYRGSLPWPPCNRDVTWIIPRQVMTISKRQLALCRALHSIKGQPILTNLRPVQPTNDRRIQISFESQGTKKELCQASIIGRWLQSVPEASAWLAIQLRADTLIAYPHDLKPSILLVPPASVIFSSNLPMNDSIAMAKLLQYHILLKSFPKQGYQFIPSSLKDKLLDGASQVVSVDAINNENAFIGDGVNDQPPVFATRPDSQTVNNKIMMIDRVLIRPPALSKVLDQAGLEFSFRLSEYSMTQQLESLHSITLFVPSNLALQLYISSLISIHTDEISAKSVFADMLTYHTFDGIFYSTKVKDQHPLEIQCKSTGEWYQLVRINGTIYIQGLKVIRTDLLLENGVAHIIDGVLGRGSEVNSKKSLWTILPVLSLLILVLTCAVGILVYRCFHRKERRQEGIKYDTININDRAQVYQIGEEEEEELLVDTRDPKAIDENTDNIKNALKIGEEQKSEDEEENDEGDEGDEGDGGR